MNECERIRAMLEAGGAELDVDALRAVEQHAAGCPACAERVREVRSIERGLRAAFRWADPGEGFTARVLRRAKPAPRSAWRLVPLAAAAAVVLAAFITAVVLSGPGRGMRIERVSGVLATDPGGRLDLWVPLGPEITASGPRAAIEVVRGVGFALRDGTKFALAPGSTRAFPRLRLRTGAAAVSVKSDSPDEKAEVVLGDFAVLAGDADFLIEARGDAGRPALYVDRGRVIVSFDGGVSAVGAGEHVELDRSVLLSRVRSDDAQIRADLAAIEAQCGELREQIARYEGLVDTYSERRRERAEELELAQEARARAPDEETANELEERIGRERAAVRNLDYVMGEHIDKVSALRAELPRRLAELQQKRDASVRHRKECKEALALLAGLR